MRALAEGVLAGFGVAIPVGPISVMLIDTGLRKGFRVAAVGALGAATADVGWASVAALAGLAVAGALEPWADTVRIASASALLAMAAYRFFVLTRASRTAIQRKVGEEGLGRTYATFLGLTALNPTTVAYFAALIIGLSRDAAAGVAGKFLFVAGAFAASASWQLFLAGLSASLHQRLSERARLMTAILGNALIAALAVRLLV